MFYGIMDYGHQSAPYWHRLYTFCHVPDIVVMGYVSLPEDLLYLWMTISDDAIKVNAMQLQ